MDVPPSQQHQITHERTSLVLVHQLDMRRPKKPIVHPPTPYVGISPHQSVGKKGGRLKLRTWPLNCNHSKWFHLFLEDIIQ